MAMSAKQGPWTPQLLALKQRRTTKRSVLRRGGHPMTLPFCSFFLWGWSWVTQEAGQGLLLIAKVCCRPGPGFMVLWVAHSYQKTAESQNGHRGVRSVRGPLISKRRRTGMSGIAVIGQGVNSSRSQETGPPGGAQALAGSLGDLSLLIRSSLVGDSRPFMPACVSLPRFQSRS